MKITLRQRVNGNRDPVLYVTVTEAPEYMKGRLVLDNIEESVTKIEKWLRRNMNANSSSSSEKASLGND